MFRKLWGVVGLVVTMMAVSSGAHAQVWTAVAASGAIEYTALNTYYTSSPALAFRVGATGTVAAIYNVDNPRDTSSSPFWTNFEFTALNPGGSPGIYANATLYRVARGAGGPVSSVCLLVAPATGATSTSTCTFSSSLIDFTNYYYFVRVILGRDSTSAIVAAYELRIY